MKIKKKIYPIIFILFIITHNFSQYTYSAPAPGVSATLSIVPGLGQVSNGNALEGLGWFSVIIGGMLFAGPNNQTPFFDLWMYNIYDAYKDAGANRTAQVNVYQNWISAFNPTLIWGPYSTIPLAGQTAIAVGSKNRPRFALAPNSPALTPLYMSFVGLGEEALFRGLFYASFMNLTESRLFSTLTSSLIFAAAHGLYSGQRSYAFQPYIFGLRTVLGIFYCLQTQKDKYDLRKSIFSHTWFDVIYEWDRQGLFGGGHIGSKHSSKPSGIKAVIQFKF